MKNLHILHQKRVYFIGIGGISMSGLAKLAIARGAIVSGSDMSSSPVTEELEGMGAIIHVGHEASNITSDIDLVVYTLAISSDNPELLRARELGLPVMERAEMLGHISREYERVVAIAGTHGKTTTTAMLGLICVSAGLNPTIHLGGNSKALGGNTILGDNKYLIVEACEYKESFRFLSPDIGLVTNVELDHVDYYKNIREITEAFSRFVTRSHISICRQDDGIGGSSTILLGHDWKLGRVEFVYNGYNFVVYHKGKVYGEFRLNVLGLHNVDNALCAIACAYELGIAKDIIAQAISDFDGVDRRYECIHTFSTGCRLIIDYAHHPTELKRSIEGINGVYPRTLYIFQPHTYSRTFALFDDFVKVLSSVEHLILYATYPAREKELAGGTARDLAEALGERVIYCENKDDILEQISQNNMDFDCILVLGAGNLAEILKRNHF